VVTLNEQNGRLSWEKPRPNLKGCNAEEEESVTNI
jgi:hypothetical protein